MQTLENIFSRRSIRAFTTDPIEDEALQTILHAAAAAPSGSNAQPWLFIAVRERARLAALRALAPGIIGRPAAVVILCLRYPQDAADVGTVDNRQEAARPDAHMASMPYFDLGAALQNILLAAHELGFGGCPIGSFHRDGLVAFLNLPAGVDPCLLVALGKPKFVPPAPVKRPMAEICFVERYEARDGE